MILRMVLNPEKMPNNFLGDCENTPYIKGSGNAHYITGTFEGCDDLRDIFRDYSSKCLGEPSFFLHVLIYVSLKLQKLENNVSQAL